VEIHKGEILCPVYVDDMKVYGRLKVYLTHS